MPRKRQSHKKKPNHVQFWNKEYHDKGGHLALSNEPSEDLVKFTRWSERRFGGQYFNSHAKILDLGCGNGRNLIYLSQTYGCAGFGIDISEEAIHQAKNLSRELPIDYKVASIAETLPVTDDSQNVILDMMTSHFLNEQERANLLNEILRVLKPGGLLFFKTFLADEDRHAARLLREHPAGETGSYIHPTIGKAEHVFTEAEISQMLEPHFIIHKIVKSHKHLINGRAGKRRSISVYAEKIK